MKLDLVSSDKAFATMGTVWNELLEDSGSNEFFSTHEWLLTWWLHFGGHRELLILAVKDNGRLLALAPLMSTQLPLLGKQKIEFLGTGLSDYLDFIITDKREECLAMVFGWLLRRRDWAMIDLRCMKEDSPNRKPLMNLLAGRNWLVEVRHECNCLRVETGGEWEDYYHNSVNRKLRESLRRRKKGLRRLGQVSVERHVALDRIEEVLELFFQAHISRWKAMGKSSPFENKSMRQFYLSLAANLAKKNMLQLTTLTIDGRPIGYHFGFLHNNKLYGYSTAFEMGFARYSPGSLLLEAEIKTAFEAGLREVDMLRGEERYKYEWTDKKKELLAVAIYDRAFYRWLLHSYYTRIKPTLQASEGFKKVRYWARAVKRRGGNHSI